MQKEQIDLYKLRSVCSGQSRNWIKSWLETQLSMGAALEVLTDIDIHDNGEALVAIPAEKFSLASPHPYTAAGAVYHEKTPYYLRTGVVSRLLAAAEKLENLLPGAKLHIYDAYRPLSVQIYMRNFEHSRLAALKGWNKERLSAEQDREIWDLVNKVWAQPANNPRRASAHGSGAAVDVTIVNASGDFLEMGSDFDEPSDRILPGYYKNNKSAEALKFNANRELLRQVMENVGFCRLAHEWWHFSYGDQFWALIEGLALNSNQSAIYNNK